MYFIILGALLGVVSVLQEATGTKKVKKKKSSKTPYVLAGLLGAWMGFCDYAKKRK